MNLWHWRGPPYVAETFVSLSFCAFLNLIIILIKENKKKLTLCQRNEQNFKVKVFIVLRPYLAVCTLEECVNAVKLTVAETMQENISLWLPVKNPYIGTNASTYGGSYVASCPNYRFLCRDFQPGFHKSQYDRPFHILAKSVRNICLSPLIRSCDFH